MKDHSPKGIMQNGYDTIFVGGLLACGSERMRGLGFGAHTHATKDEPKNGGQWMVLRKTILMGPFHEKAAKLVGLDAE